MVVCVAGLSMLTATGGCGGSDHKTTTDGKRAAPGAEVPPPRLPPSDRKAFKEIQRSAGALRAAVVPVAYGSAPIVAVRPLDTSARRLKTVDPRDGLLRRLRTRTLKALRTAAAEGSQADKARQTATEAIAEADRVDAGLRQYAASHPAANEVAPG